MKKLFLLLAAIALAATASTEAFGQHPSDRKITSRLEIYDLETGTRVTLKEYPYVVEAPNWTMDGKYLIYNTKGKIHRIEIAAPENDVHIPTAPATNCNNDHVLSFDGKGLAVSSGTEGDWRSKIYVLPLEGGEARLVTPEGPSYLHGWSPDGKTLAYCADRNGNFDVYTIPVEGGEEVRLTDAEGLDDGPEYSPNGEWIWFNSVRSGLMQVWRMKADGTEQTQITLDETRNSWFPHVSPDNQKVIYIAYAKGDVQPGDHPAGKNVEIRIISARQGGEEMTLVKLFGGQGTLNVNSWSPCSRYFAFVSYEYGE